MNPFTKYLSQWSADDDFSEFIAQWDRLEKLVILVYRGKVPVAEAGDEYNRIWPWLRERYPAFEATLRPHWQVTRAAGEPTTTDPFWLLLEIDSPAAIPGDWQAMQHLPAAREALNRYLLAANSEAKSD